jgi:tetratricopeptide (TPR) repeat protein
MTTSAVEISYGAKKWTDCLKHLSVLPDKFLTARQWFIRGHCLDETRQYTSAVDAYTKGITLDGGMPHAFYNRANVFVDLGWKDLARSDYEKAKNLFTKQKDKDDCDRQLRQL